MRIFACCPNVPPLLKLHWSQTQLFLWIQSVIKVYGMFYSVILISRKMFAFCMSFLRLITYLPTYFTRLLFIFLGTIYSVIRSQNQPRNLFNFCIIMFNRYVKHRCMWQTILCRISWDWFPYGFDLDGIWIIFHLTCTC